MEVYPVYGVPCTLLQCVQCTLCFNENVNVTKAPNCNILIFVHYWNRLHEKNIVVCYSSSFYSLIFRHRSIFI